MHLPVTSFRIFAQCSYVSFYTKVILLLYTVFKTVFSDMMGERLTINEINKQEIKPMKADITSIRLWHCESIASRL